MYSSPRLALIITLLTVSASSYAQHPPSSSISAVHLTPPLDAYPSQEVIIFPDADLLNACLFNGQGRTYNVCPLMEKENVVDVQMDILGEHRELKPVHRRYRIMLGTNHIVTGLNKPVNINCYCYRGGGDTSILLLYQSHPFADPLFLGATSNLGLSHRCIFCST